MHCMFELENQHKELTYRYYVTDLLKYIAEFNGAQVSSRYYDVINNTNNENNKTGDEIALDIITRAGLKMKGNNDESI